jgi:hypothetical protein
MRRREIRLSASRSCTGSSTCGCRELRG